MRPESLILLCVIENATFCLLFVVYITGPCTTGTVF